MLVPGLHEKDYVANPQALDYNDGMNWDIIGHEWAISLLKQNIVNNRVCHAYLFTGSQGIGRRTIALRFAQALNCKRLSKDGEPCGKCRTCTQIGDEKHPDLAVVQAGQEGRTLKVKQIRELQHSLSLSPYEAKYRVALILRFEEATRSAANALLKTLEEPPPHVILLVTAESIDSLLPTIVSRCEVLRLRSVKLDSIAENLQNRFEVPVERAQLISHISGGRPGYAFKLHKDTDWMEKRKKWLGDVNRLLEADYIERFAYAEEVAKKKDDLRELLQVWLSLWRDVLLKTTESSTPLTNLDVIDEIVAFSERYDLKDDEMIISKLERSLRLIERNVNTRHLMEVLLMDLPVG